jgi:adenosylcobinamide-GDP ribazoletransferase
VRRLRELVQAFALLTRLPALLPGPLPQGEGESAARLRAKDCVWAFPIVGAVVGATGAAAYWLARGIGAPPVLAAVLALAAQIAATGGFHEDGLADTVDGFGGGTTPGEKLAIMRDSRIGTFGVIALVLVLALRGGAIISIPDHARVGAALVVAGTLGRAAIVGMLAALHPARADGLGASVESPDARRVAVAMLVGIAVAFAMLPAPLASGAVLIAAAAGAATAWLGHAQIGGFTGDVLGAGEQATECTVLALLATAAAP